MALLLSIDTALATAVVALSKNGDILLEDKNTEAKNHAAFIQPAINKIMQQAGISLDELDAVAVTAGPGSYTGLRVGMASAKGICFAINKPLILIDNLWLMTMAAIEYCQPLTIDIPNGFCPMIDARRMEVFTAIHNAEGKTILAPQAAILSESSFTDQLNSGLVYFFGNGSTKWQTVCKHPNAKFISVDYTAAHLALTASQLFDKQQFTDLAYAEPNYIKPFYDTQKG